ncbi:MAG: fimbrillin family protein [Bacteroidaceae bacterium]|nr:fimbrillin family protein [Bacteroidaceae bacterium]
MAMTTIFGLSSCDKELLSVENTDKPFILFATTETGTKTALSWNEQEKHYDVVWSENDEFSVFKKVTKTNPNTLLLETKFPNIGNFILTDGAGTTSGTFEFDGEIGTGTFWAYYPATDAENYVDMISTWRATAQTYTAGKITNSPMTASFTIAANSFKSKRPAPTTVTFTNLGGILRLTVKNSENVSISKITVCADQLESPITLDCSNGGSGVALTTDGTQFNIAMPSADGIKEEGSSKDTLASYSNVSIYLTDMEGNICCKSLKSGVKLDIVRSKITNASFSVSKDKFISAGVKFTISGHEGIVVDLGGELGKVIVATMNVGATSVNEDGCLGGKMNYDAACAAWSGWRLPTVDELTAFCDPGYPGVCGDTYGAAGCTGAVMWNIDDNDGIDLYLPLNDYDDGGENPSDIYWTGTPGGNGIYFYFAPAIDWENVYFPLEPDYIRKEEAAKSSEFLVRLFHDLP